MVWQLADTDWNMFGISMLMLNYRDQSEGEDILLFVKRKKCYVVSSEIYLLENTDIQSCDQELSGH